MDLKITEYTGLPKKCEEIEDYQTKLFLVLMQKNKTISKWELYLNGCKNYIFNNYQIKLDLEDEANTREFIQKIIGPDDELTAVNEKNYLLFEKDMSNFIRLHNKTKKELIENNISNVFFKDGLIDIFFSLNYNIISNNINGAQKNLEKLIKSDLLYLSYDIHRFIRPESREDFKKIFLSVVKKVWNSNIDEKLKIMFMENLKDLDDISLNNLIDGFLGELFLSRIKFSNKNYKYCLSYPIYWTKRLDDSQKYSFLRDYFKSPLANEMSNNEIRLFKYYYPLNDEIRISVRDKVLKNRRNLNIYEMDSLFEALDNQVFKKFLSEKDEMFKIPIFSLRKNYYEKNLYSEGFGIYSVINLMNLGYENKKLLNWLL